MAAGKARVVLNGRFPPGARVKLIRVAGEHVLRPGAADEEVGAKIVDENGRVEFTSGVEADARYFLVGYVGGFPREVRARGRFPGDDDEVNTIAPVTTEPRKFSSGGGDVDPPAAELVQTAEEQDRLRRAGPAGSESVAAEAASIRREAREKAEAARAASEDDNHGDAEEAKD